MNSPNKNTVWPSLLILLVGLVIAVLTFERIRENQQKQIRADFGRAAGTRSEVVGQRLQSALEIPEVVGRFFLGSEVVSREEYVRFAEPFVTRLPELESLSWVALPETASPDSAVTYAVEHARANEDGPMVLGQIQGLLPVVQEAMARNKVAWTNLRRGPGADAKELWWIVVPVQAVAPGGQAGVVLAQVDLRLLLHSVFDNLEKVGLDATIYDGVGQEKLPLCVWSSATRTSPYDPVKEKAADAFIYKQTIPLGGEQWWMVSRPAPAFLAHYSRVEPWTVAAGTIAFFALLAWYVFKVRTNQNALLRREATLQLLQEVAVTSNVATGNAGLLQSCLELIGRYLGWPFGHVYLWDDEARALVSSGIFYQEEVSRYEALRKETAALRFPRGVGMPGRVLESRSAVFLGNLWEFEDFRRKSSAEATGVCTCFAFPVFVRGEVAAVVEFFSTASNRLPLGWEPLLASISIQMAHAMERTLATEELREKTGMMENAVEGIARVDERGVYLSVNKAYARMCGIAAGGLVGLNRRLLVHPEDDDLFMAAHIDMVLEGRSQANGRHVRPDGTIFYEEVTMVRDLDRHGELRGAYLFSRDVTEREKQQAALRESEDRFAAFMEHNPATAAIKDEDSRMLYVNKRAELHFGKSLEDFIGKTPEEFTTREAAEEIRRSDRRVLETNEAITILEEMPNKDGEIKHWLVCKFPMQDIKGRRLIGSMGLDVTERRHAEEAIIQARDAALQSAELKSKFLANMSHEIRTPMNGLTGMLSLLSRTNLLPEQAELLRTALGASDALLRLLNDILDFSKIEAGKLEIDPGVFDLRQCVRHAVQIGRELARQKGIALEESVEEGVPERLFGDSGRLAQILINLVSNALKFTHEGRVSVAFRLDKRLEGSLLVLHAIVRDTGIGISEAQRQSIFLPFQQADSSTARKYGGTGLGLAICSQLVGLMGGRIWVEDEPAGGTAIHFTLQMEETHESMPERHREEAPHTLALRPLRILLAEDNRLNQRLAITLLEERGHQVTLAEDGNAAVRLSSQEDFDLLLMDLQMPVKDGYEATAEIRARREKCDIPIYALTAHAMPEDRRRCLGAGMNGYLTKPIQVREFARVVEKMFDRQTPPPAPVESVAEETTAFDLVNLRQSVNQNEGLIRELAAIFCKQAVEDREQMRQALASRDAGVLERSAHRLKGSALSLSAGPLSRSAQIMETSGRQADLAGADREWQAFSATFDTLVGELQAFTKRKDD